MENMDLGFGFTNWGSTVPTSWGGWDRSHFNLRMGSGQSVDDLGSICGSNFSSPTTSPLPSPTDSVSSESLASDLFSRSNEMTSSVWEEEDIAKTNYDWNSHYDSFDYGHDMKDDQQDEEEDFTDNRDPSRHYLTARRKPASGPQRVQKFPSSSSTFGYSFKPPQPRRSCPAPKRDKTGDVKRSQTYQLDSWGEEPTFDADEGVRSRAAKSLRTRFF